METCCRNFIFVGDNHSKDGGFFDFMNSQFDTSDEKFFCALSEPVSQVKKSYDGEYMITNAPPLGNFNNCEDAIREFSRILTLEKESFLIFVVSEMHQKSIIDAFILVNAIAKCCEPYGMDMNNRFAFFVEEAKGLDTGMQSFRELSEGEGNMFVRTKHVFIYPFQERMLFNQQIRMKMKKKTITRLQNDLFSVLPNTKGPFIDKCFLRLFDQTLNNESNYFYVRGLSEKFIYKQEPQSYRRIGMAGNSDLDYFDSTSISTEEPIEHISIDHAIIFAGNPGAGKSTLMNIFSNKLLFKSGYSDGTGITTKSRPEYFFDKRLGRPVVLYDTPGITDAVTLEDTIKETSEAIREKKFFSIIFVVTLEAGSTRGPDVAILSLLISKINQAGCELTDNYGIIFNKFGKNAIQSFSTVDWFKKFGGNFPSTKHVLLLPKKEELHDEDNAYTSDFRKDLVEFVCNVPMVSIDRNMFSLSKEEFLEHYDKIYT